MSTASCCRSDMGSVIAPVLYPASFNSEAIQVSISAQAAVQRTLDLRHLVLDWQILFAIAVLCKPYSIQQGKTSGDLWCGIDSLFSIWDVLCLTVRNG